MRRRTAVLGGFRECEHEKGAECWASSGGSLARIGRTLCLCPYLRISARPATRA
ncbi:MAG: hypothetical protein GF311_28005 [Candidatus Lokiarchaeota archaeon]|nr:hypothetical protein [Candidatus Lokiarchaeota archaeon]